MARLAEVADGGLTADVDVAAAYGVAQRIAYLLAAITLGVIVAGFWNFRAVDGLGVSVAASTIGGYEGKAAQFVTLGAGFGFVFALVAGLAATFTACNCVAFAMIPGLVCARDRAAGRSTALRSLGAMLTAVVVVGAVYGAYVGLLGPMGVEAINGRAVRFAQASVVFSVLGSVMLLWSGIEFGLLDRVTARCSPVTRAFFAQPTVKAAIMGLMIGAFAIGRPFPVFREFLLYAAEFERPSYGAAVMALQGIGQILVMVVVFLVVLAAFGKRLAVWVVASPAQPTLVSACALAAGGAYFLFYWGIGRAWPWLSGWGFQLGWYS